MQFLAHAPAAALLQLGRWRSSLGCAPTSLYHVVPSHEGREPRSAFTHIRTSGSAQAAPAAPACSAGRPSRRPCVQFLGSCKAQVLRNTPGAGSSGCSCSASSRLSSGWQEPEARAHDLLTLGRTKGPGTCGTARSVDTQRQGRCQDSGGRAEHTLVCLDCEGIKAQGFKVPPQRHRLELFLCSCTVNKLFCGTRHVRLCHGKPGLTV